MIPINNPFIRGYQNLAIQRLLAIRYEEDCPLTYLPLHSSQAHLADDQVHRFPCVFCDDFALVTEGQDVSSELDDHCICMSVIPTATRQRWKLSGDSPSIPATTAVAGKSVQAICRATHRRTLSTWRMWLHLPACCLKPSVFRAAMLLV